MQPVGVLIFIHHNIAIALRQFQSQVFMLREEPQAFQEQIVIIQKMVLTFVLSIITLRVAIVEYD